MSNYYTREEVTNLVMMSRESICYACRFLTDCKDECIKCDGVSCPCGSCIHNKRADMSSSIYGDKFSLVLPNKKELKSREDYLNEAINATVSRDNKESTLGLIAELWSSLFGIYIEPHMVASAMIALKLARIAKEHETQDSFVDIAGYAAIGGEAYSEEK